MSEISDDRRIECPLCDQPVTGEMGTYTCEWHSEEECDCGPWAPGEWYLDGEEYVCDGCGAVLDCTVDDVRARLEVSEHD